MSDTQHQNGPALRILGFRVAETIVASVVIAAITTWATQQVMGEKLANLSAQVAEVKADLRTIRDDFYAPRMMQQPQAQR